MKPIAPDPLRLRRFGDGVTGRDLRVRRVERGVEADELAHVGPRRSHRVDGGEVVGVVQRRERRASLDLRPDARAHLSRGGQARAAMNHAMRRRADGVDPVAMFGERPEDQLQRIFVRLRRARIRPPGDSQFGCAADLRHRARQALGQIGGEDRELDGGRPRVEDEDRPSCVVIRHISRLSAAACRPWRSRRRAPAFSSRRGGTARPVPG